MNIDKVSLYLGIFVGSVAMCAVGKIYHKTVIDVKINKLRNASSVSNEILTMLSKRASVIRAEVMPTAEDFIDCEGKVHNKLTEELQDIVAGFKVAPEHGASVNTRINDWFLQTFPTVY
ncbi:TPA: hypothetical protein ACGJ7A_006197 [Pseudomonas aeruginosa]